VERATGQASNLGVAALARVFAYSVWKGDYLLERPQEDVVEGVTAGVAAGQGGESPNPQLTRPTHRADEVARPGR